MKIDNYENPFASSEEEIGIENIPVDDEIKIRQIVRESFKERKALNEILLLDKEYAPIDNPSYETICLESQQFFAIIDRFELLQEGLWDDLSKKAKKYIDKMGAGFKKKYDEIKSIADEAKVGLKTMLEVLRAKDNFLFKLFSSIGWKNLGKNLLDMIKKAKKVYADFRKALVQWIKNDPAILAAIESGKLVGSHIDSLLEKFPIIKKIGGPVIAAILLLVWMNMSFTGDWDSDFNMTPILSAFTGDYNLTELFLSDAGLEMLALLALGTTVGLSFPWLQGLSTAKKVAAAFVYTFGYIFLKKKLKPGDSSSEDDDESSEENKKKNEAHRRAMRLLREQIRTILLE